MNPQELREQMKASIRQAYNDKVASGEIMGDSLPDPEGQAAPPAAPEGAPAPKAPPAPEPQAARKKEEQKPEESLIFGKYKDMSEAENNYYKSLNYASQTAEENRQLKERLAALEMGHPQQAQQNANTVPGSLPGSGPRVNPAARDWKNERTVRQLSEKLAVEPDELADFAQSLDPGLSPEVIQDIVREAVKAELAPLQAQAEADAYVRQNMPESYKFQPEIENFLKTSADPLVKRSVQDLIERNNLAGAWAYAWNEFQRSQQAAAQNQMTQEANGAEANRVNARNAAAMPTSSPGTPVHAADPANQAPDPEYIKQLAQAARSGDRDAQTEYRRLTFGRLPGMEKLRLVQDGLPIPPPQ